MARRTFSDCDGELQLRLANRSDLTAAIRGQFLNDALRWCCKSYKHPQIEATSTGTLSSGSDTISVVATNVWWFEVIQDSDSGRVLEPGDKNEIEDRIKQTGTPTEYYWWAALLRTDRKPSATINYALWYVKTLDEWTTGASPLDALFDPVLIMKAAQIGLSTVRDFKESALLKAEIDGYTERWSLPVREDKKNTKGAGVRPRTR